MSGVLLSRRRLVGCHILDSDLAKSSVDALVIEKGVLKRATIHKVRARGWKFTGCTWEELLIVKVSFETSVLEIQVKGGELRDVTFLGCKALLTSFDDGRVHPQGSKQPLKRRDWSFESCAFRRSDLVLGGRGQLSSVSCSESEVKFEPNTYLTSGTRVEFASCSVIGPDLTRVGKLLDTRSEVSWIDANVLLAFDDCLLAGMWVGAPAIHEMSLGRKPPPFLFRRCRGIVLTEIYTEIDRRALSVVQGMYSDIVFCDLLLLKTAIRQRDGNAKLDELENKLLGEPPEARLGRAARLLGDIERAILLHRIQKQVPAALADVMKWKIKSGKTRGQAAAT